MVVARADWYARQAATLKSWIVGCKGLSLPLDETLGPRGAVNGSISGNRVLSKERVFLDLTAAGAPIQPMDFRYRTVRTSLETVTTHLDSGFEIVIQFQVGHVYGVRRVVNGILRSMHSWVPTY